MVCKAWALIKPPKPILTPNRKPFQLKVKWNLNISPNWMFLKQSNVGSEPSKTYLFFELVVWTHFQNINQIGIISLNFQVNITKIIETITICLGRTSNSLVTHGVNRNFTDRHPLRFPTLRRPGCHRSCYPIASIRSFYTPSNRWFRNPKAKSHQPKMEDGIPIVCYSYSRLEQFLFKKSMWIEQQM